MAGAASPVAPVVLVAHPSRERYGSDRQCVETVLALVEAGWRVVAAVPPVRGTSPGAADLADDLAAAGAEVVEAEVPVLRRALLSGPGLVGLAWRSAAALPVLLRLTGRIRPDAVYVSTLTAPLWLLVARLAKRSTVAHVHEAEEAAPALVRAALAAPLLLADRVLVNSEASAGALHRSLRGLAGRTRVLHNGVPGPSDPAPPREVLHGELRLVLVGRLSPRKGSDVAVAALEQLRLAGLPARLSLVGAVFPGYEWFERQLREQVRAAGLEDAVDFAGLADSTWPALADADVALVPSRVEPFGNTAVEAMLAGRPVIASATQGLVEVVSDGVDGTLVPPGDAAALAAAVGELVDDWPSARQRAQRARSAALERFSVEGYRREVVAELERVAGRS